MHRAEGQGRRADRVSEAKTAPPGIQLGGVSFCRIITVFPPLPAQRISRFLLLYKELDADDGELTRTRKVRRSVINEKYAGIIESIYAGQNEIPVDTVIKFQDGTTQRIRTTLRVIDLAPSAPLAEAAE